MGIPMEVVDQIDTNVHTENEAPDTVPNHRPVGVVEESESSDEENQEGPSQAIQTREMTLLLISLYKEFQSEMEDTRTKNKDIWLKICKKMREQGYDFANMAKRVEQKWRNLERSHKKSNG